MQEEYDHDPNIGSVAHDVTLEHDTLRHRLGEKFNLTSRCVLQGKGMNHIRIDTLTS
jgi:hypothetical protein